MSQGWFRTLDVVVQDAYALDVIVKNKNAIPVKIER